MFGFRWLFVRLFLGKKMYPEAFISPRGLITVLLFYAIPKEHISADFEEGILLFVILFSSVIMAVALIKDSRRNINSDGAQSETGDEVLPETEDEAIGDGQTQ